MTFTTKPLPSRFLLFASVLFVSALVPASALDLSDGPRVLDRIDSLTSFEGDLTAVMTVISEDPDEGVERQVVQQFRRDEDGMFLMLIKEPATKLGQGYLLVDDNLWFYDPESRNFSYTSMKEEFAGSDARNSDFGASTLTEDYEVVSIEDSTLGAYQTHTLELRARNNEVTYATKSLWVTRDLFLPLKMEDFSESGRLMRTTLLPNYARAGDNYIATTMIFEDELIAGKRTRINVTDISVADLPDSVFTKAYVERVNR